MHDVVTGTSKVEENRYMTAFGTKNPQVVLSQRLGPVTSAELELADLGADVTSAYLGTHDAIAEGGQDADIIILGAVEPFDGAALAALPRLKAVVRRGVGFDNVDVDAATSAGILVANVPDASIEEVSDHALSMLLALERRLFGIDGLVRDGTSKSAPGVVQQMRVQSRRFSDLTLGIVGFGRIGAALARKAGAAYRQVLVYDVVPQSPERLGACRQVTLDELLAGSDHVSLHLATSHTNRELIGAEQISQMKAGSVLVNTARGGVVDEAALVDAVRAGAVAAAGLDVTEREPVDEDSILLDTDLSDRLILTAHSAAWSQTAVEALTTGSVDAAAYLLRGELPRSVVNPTVLESPTLRLRGLRGHARGQPTGDEQGSGVSTKNNRSGESQ